VVDCVIANDPFGRYRLNPGWKRRLSSEWIDAMAVNPTLMEIAVPDASFTADPTSWWGLLRNEQDSGGGGVGS